MRWTRFGTTATCSQIAWLGNLAWFRNLTRLGNLASLTNLVVEARRWFRFGTATPFGQITDLGLGHLAVGAVWVHIYDVVGALRGKYGRLGCYG